MWKTLDMHLLAGLPTRDVSEPYLMEELTTTIEQLLHWYRFDWKACSTTHCAIELAPELDAKPNESDLDSSDESNYDTRYRKKSWGSMKTSGHSPTREYFGKSARKHKEEKKSSKTTSTDIDRLIDDKSSLSISDPAYTWAYYKAFMLNPSITQIFNKPKQQVALNPSSNTTGAERRQTHSSTMMTTQSNICSPNTLPLFLCYGCSSHQHTLRNCQLIQDLLCRGLLVYNQWRHITLPDDEGPLQCEGGKMLLDTYYRTT